MRLRPAAEATVGVRHAATPLKARGLGLAAADRLTVDAHGDRCSGPWRMRRARFADAARSIRIVVRARKILAGPAPHRGLNASRARPSDGEASAPTERDGHDHRCQPRTRRGARQQRPRHPSDGSVAPKRVPLGVSLRETPVAHRPASRARRFAARWRTADRGYVVSPAWLVSGSALVVLPPIGPTEADPGLVVHRILTRPGPPWKVPDLVEATWKRSVVNSMTPPSRLSKRSAHGSTAARRSAVRSISAHAASPGCISSSPSSSRRSRPCSAVSPLCNRIPIRS